ncbi:MAG: hypothetical protein M3Z96_06050 [Pseudomonadota bacterium]|nr:hypothetical protein [Pseudomonadota bacterium]
MTEIEDRPGAASPELDRIPRGAAPITDENGAIEAGDAAGVRALAGRSYEAGLGLLTASLEPELRSKLVEMTRDERLRSGMIYSRLGSAPL